MKRYKMSILLMVCACFLLLGSINAYAKIDTVQIHSTTHNIHIHRDGGITDNMVPEVTVLMQNIQDNSIGYLNQFPVEEDGRIDIKFKFEEDLSQYKLMIRDTDGAAVPFENIQVSSQEKTTIVFQLELDNNGVFIAEDEKAHAKLILENTFGDEDPYVLILATYDNRGYLTSCSISDERTMPYDGHSFEDVFSAPVPAETHMVKAFCFSDAEEMIPYTEAEEWKFQGFVDLPNIISDHMLVQADEPIRIWGNTSVAGGPVTAELLDEDGNVKSSGSGQSNADGSFLFEMTPVNAGNTVYTLKVSADGAEEVVKDVLVGELWLLSGQSNMEMKVGEMHATYKTPILPDAAVNGIRYFRRTSSTVSSDMLGKDVVGKWMIADATTVKNFSAVGWCALKELHEQLGVPVGGLQAGYGGTQMYQWAAPNNRLQLEEGTHFHKYVRPFMPMNIKGVFWYQGESDTRTLKYANYDEFSNLFENLITGWRGAFSDEDMPFIFVQFPLWADRDIVPGMLAQLDIYHSVPNTGMALAIDCPPNMDYDSTENGGMGSVHPTNKEPVGKRLAYNALSMVYGKGMPTTGPLYLSNSVENNVMTITFSATENGLKTTDGEAPKYFELAGADGVYYAADAVIGEDGKTIELTSSKVASPVYARYFCIYDKTWTNNYPVGNLVSSSGMPVSPFITNPKVTPKEH